MKLHLGGQEALEGWKIVNVQPGPHVDYICDIRDLSGFDDGCAESIYTSHTLEHLSYNSELRPVLADIFRLLAPGGELMVSVPNLDVLCRLYVHPQADAALRHHLMRILFGGQVDQWDFHKAGFSADLLAAYLQDAGFTDLREVESFGLFDDTSDLQIAGQRISLNVIARKPGT